MLFDLEPLVIDTIKQSEYHDFYNPENMYVAFNRCELDSLDRMERERETTGDRDMSRGAHAVKP